MLRLALAAAATLVALAFALSTLERWLDRRRRHDLAWTVALVFFAAGSAALWAGATFGWNDVSFRLFYLFGGVLNVPFLALGTVYLLADRRRADRWAAAVCLAGAFAAGVVLTSPLRAPVPRSGLPLGSDVFGPLPRILAAVGSGVAATVIVGGALWSAARFRRRPAGGRLAVANLLIAAGTLVLSGKAFLHPVLDEADAFSVALVLGIALIFTGFLVAAGSRRPPLRLASGDHQAAVS